MIEYMTQGKFDFDLEEIIKYNYDLYIDEILKLPIKPEIAEYLLFHAVKIKNIEHAQKLLELGTRIIFLYELTSQVFIGGLYINIDKFEEEDLYNLLETYRKLQQ